MTETTTLFVAMALDDAQHWAGMNDAAQRLGGLAAVLQGEGPSLVAQLDALAELGPRRVVLAAVTFGKQGAAVSWLGRVARWWLATRPDAGLELTLLPRSFHAMPESLPDAQSRTLVAAGDGLTCSEWNHVPSVCAHLLVCRGPRCSARGAGQTAEALDAALSARGLADAVLVTQTGCLYPCNRAPVIAVQPDMAWYGPVNSEGVSLLVDRLAQLVACSGPSARLLPGVADDVRKE